MEVEVALGIASLGGDRRDFGSSMLIEEIFIHRGCPLYVATLRLVAWRRWLGAVKLCVPLRR